MKLKSFVSAGKVCVNFSDLVLFNLLSSVLFYINCWEHAIVRSLITQVKRAVET